MKTYATIITIILFTGFCYSQPSGPNPGTTPTPIGGISLLILAVAYGGKKVYDTRK